MVSVLSSLALEHSYPLKKNSFKLGRISTFHHKPITQNLFFHNAKRIQIIIFLNIADHAQAVPPLCCFAVFLSAQQSLENILLLLHLAPWPLHPTSKILQLFKQGCVLSSPVFVTYLPLVTACHISAHCRGGTTNRKGKVNISVYKKIPPSSENEQLKLYCYAKQVAGKTDNLFLICFPGNFPGLHFSEKAQMTFKVSSNTTPVTLTISSIKTSKYPFMSKALNEDVSKTQVFLKEE